MNWDISNAKNSQKCTDNLVVKVTVIYKPTGKRISILVVTEANFEFAYLN